MRPEKCHPCNKENDRGYHVLINCGECGLEFRNRNNFSRHTYKCVKRKTTQDTFLDVMRPTKDVDKENSKVAFGETFKWQNIGKRELSNENIQDNTINPNAYTDIPDTKEEKKRKRVQESISIIHCQQISRKHTDHKCGSTLTAPNKPGHKDRKQNLKELTSCYVCGKPFAHNFSLTLHMRRHNGVKSHCCVTCNKRFVDKGDLQKHMRIHTGEKPFSCGVCKKAFYTQGNLGKHSRIHSHDRKHKCHICDKGFNARSDLQKHIRVHTGEKPFPCSYCVKSFTTNSGLNVHVRKHTGIRPHLCETCGKAFKTSGDLGKHIRIHKGTKPYKCAICKMAFTTSNNFRQHERVKHR